MNCVRCHESQPSVNCCPSLTSLLTCKEGWGRVDQQVESRLKVLFPEVPRCSDMRGKVVPNAVHKAFCDCSKAIILKFQKSTLKKTCALTCTLLLNLPLAKVYMLILSDIGSRGKGIHLLSSEHCKKGHSESRMAYHSIFVLHDF